MRSKTIDSLLALVPILVLMTGCLPGKDIALIFAAGPTATLAAVDEYAYQLAETGVTRNVDWIPHIEIVDGVEMALVPAGCFMMGSEDGGRFEQPVHQVCFDEPFWIDVTEVTQAQFADFGGQAGRGSYFFDLMSGGNLPREGITWIEADAFCQRRGVRLPTEAEWEYAARGPDGLIYPWGNEFAPDKVVYNYGPDPATQTRPVGSKPGGASWTGIFDMSGNVEEWVNDWLSETYYGELDEGVVNPQGPVVGESRVRRGGAWSPMNPLCLRSAFRVGGGNSSVMETNDLGFRCARSYGR